MYDYTNKDVNVRNYINYDLNRTITMFNYEGLPDTIPLYNLEYLLQTKGYIFVTEINNNLYALSGSLSGELDEYNEPTQIIIDNIALNIHKSYDIKKDGVLIKNDFLKMGVLPLLERYNSQLVESDITMLMSNINNRVQTLISASDNKTVESAKEFLNLMYKGKLGVIAEQQLFESLKTANVSQANTSMKDLIEFHQYLKASKFNELGLNTMLNMKRERLNVAEVESNTGSLYPLVDNMLQCRQLAINDINEKYDTNITVNFFSSWNDRVDNDHEPLTDGVKENEQREEKSNNENN